MKYAIALISLLLWQGAAHAQKPFTEGVITYNITLESADHQKFTGKYVFTIKGVEIRKELKLSNGYADVTLINCSTGAVYSLQTKAGKNYAIELSMSELTKKQDRFTGFTLGNEQANNKVIAGIQASKTTVTYRDGSTAELYYTKDWSPAQGITYEHFPNPKFLPLSFSYSEEGRSLRLDAEQVAAAPVENAVFRIPAEYKMISYKEYKSLSQ